jgi:2,4-dienoyl-CoA reductase-like NADH-dependent reductase (Old Yellow Enzyme family)/thioredoxin reductase
MSQERAVLGGATTPKTDLTVLLEPIEINGIRLPNRIVMAPMGSYQDRDGIVGERTIAYYRRRALGGTGAITVENVVVSPNVECWDFPLCAPEHVERMRKIVDAVHGDGETQVGVQLVHPGRVSVTGLVGFVAPTPTPLHDGAAIPHTLTIREIREIVADFGASAAYAKEAGFDYVEVHGAHGFLIGDFLGSIVNYRDDEYGGDQERRFRFAIEIVEAIRSSVGPDFPVWFRISMIDAGESGITLEESLELCERLEGAGVDCLSVSAGTHTSLEITMAPMFVQRGHMVPLARQVKERVSIPVAAVGRLDDPELAASVLQHGDADLITIGRGLIAEPDWVKKIAEGRRDELRPCLACNACADYITLHGGIRCAVNPEVGREAEWELVPAEEARSIMVIGGGPAGLQAAQTAAMRGHRVALWDREDELGGKLGVASLAPGKEVVTELRDQMVRELGRLGVEIHSGVEVTANDVERENPDAVILAVGAEPLVPPIPGADLPIVLDAVSLLLGEHPVEAGEHIVVVGSAATGLETAENLVAQGATVTLVEMLKQVGAGIEAILKDHIVRALRASGVEILTSTKVMAIEPGRVVCRADDGAELVLETDRVALAVGFRPIGQFLADALSGREVHLVGDAAHAGDFVNAIGSGAVHALTV